MVYITLQHYASADIGALFGRFLVVEEACGSTTHVCKFKIYSPLSYVKYCANETSNWCNFCVKDFIPFLKQSINIC